MFQDVRAVIFFVGDELAAGVPGEVIIGAAGELLAAGIVGPFAENGGVCIRRFGNALQAVGAGKVLVFTGEAVGAALGSVVDQAQEVAYFIVFKLPIVGGGFGEVLAVVGEVVGVGGAVAVGLAACGREQARKGIVGIAFEQPAGAVYAGPYSKSRKEIELNSQP